MNSDFLQFAQQKYRHQKILLWGMGVTGKSALAFFNDLHVVCDVLNRDEISLGQLSFGRFWKEDELLKAKDFPSYDLIIKSPGIPQDHPLVEKLKHSSLHFTSDIEEALSLFPSETPLVAITGSNGKTTTVNLLFDATKRIEGLRPFLGGNVGTPLFDILRTAQNLPNLLILELSSFQLEYVEKMRPTIAAILNLTPTHGERYPNYKSYIEAKLNIAKKMTKEGTLFVNEKFFEELKKEEITFERKGPIEIYDSPAQKQSFAKKLDLTSFKLLGEHNRSNLMVIDEIFKKMNWPLSALQKTVNSFQAPPHRCEYIGENDKIVVYNDSKSTNFSSTLEALKAVKEKHSCLVTLILGGKLRDKSEELKVDDLIAKREMIDVIYLVGESTDPLWEKLSTSLSVLPTGLLNRTLQDIQEKLPLRHQKVVLLFSPAFPSFDLYKNYEHRGEEFVKEVRHFFPDLKLT